MAVTVLVQQRAQNAAANTTLLLHIGFLLAQSIAQLRRVHAASHHTLRQERHHQWCQHGQQVTGIVAQACGLAQLACGLVLLATKDVTQNIAAI